MECTPDYVKSAKLGNDISSSTQYVLSYPPWCHSIGPIHQTVHDLEFETDLTMPIFFDAHTTKVRFPDNFDVTVQFLSTVFCDS